MRFSYSWIKEFTKADLNPQEIADLLSAKSSEVKEVIPSGEDTILDIDILPNHPDALSHIGIAREISALSDAEFIEKTYKPKLAALKDLSITIEDADACPRYSALVIRNVAVGPSPKWLKERLESLGLKSINNIVDATNYVMLEMGQPLHAFDMGKVDKIVVRRARDGERIKTLDEAQTEYELGSSVLVIADGAKPLAIAGIKGGTETGITHTTRDIIVESANFASEAIRAASNLLSLRTDASERFSYGVDPELTVQALSRVAEIIKEIASGESGEAVIDVYPKRFKPLKFKLETSYIRSLLGAEITDTAIAAILKRFGFGVSGSKKTLVVTVPSRRLDIQRAEDLIEEVGRAYGYENIPSKPPMVAAFNDRKWVKEETSSWWDEYEFIRERGYISHLLASIGFIEVYNYALLSDELKEAFGYEDIKELENPATHEYRYLRPSLIPRLAYAVCDNFRFADQVRLFETGHVFGKLDEPEGKRLALAIGYRSNIAVRDVFLELKSAIDLLICKLGITDTEFTDTGRGMATLTTGDGVTLGTLSVLRPQIAERLKLKGAVAVAEFDLTKLIKHFQEEREYEPLPKYPAAIRDISILVPLDVRIGDIMVAIEGADAKGIVRDVDVFDIYEPGEEEKGENKSVAFHVVYRADDHTLTDAEVTDVEDAIKRELIERFQAEIR